MEKFELIGIDYLWKIILEIPSEEIAMLAVKLLMRMSYTWLSQKLKKVLILIKSKCSYGIVVGAVIMPGCVEI